MMRTDEPLRCDEALDLLEPFLDGELTPEEDERLRRHLAGCAACAAELAFSRRVQAGLRALPQPDCPPELLARVLEAGRGEVVPFPARARTIHQRFAAAAAVAALAVGGGALFLHSQQLQQRAEARQAQQVAEATREARLAFAYIGKATRKAGLDVRDEVLQKRLVLPAAQALSRLSNDFPNDVPNEASPAGEPRQEP